MRRVRFLLLLVVLAASAVAIIRALWDRGDVPQPSVARAPARAMRPLQQVVVPVPIVEAPEPPRAGGR
jgi:hypothetical protein